jgi:hypothetical protein
MAMSRWYLRDLGVGLMDSRLVSCRSSGEDPEMPAVPRRPVAQQECDPLQGRRLGAAELFAVGVRQAEVARQLGVSPRP